MSKDDIKKGYQHYWKPAKEVAYPEGYKHHLIHTPERFHNLLKVLEDKSEIGLDFETTSLDFNVAELVGMGVCAEKHRAFYLPFRHKVDSDLNLPMELFQQFLEEVIKDKLSIWFNFGYDGMILEKEGCDIEDLDFLDTQSLVWLADTNKKDPNLKWAAKHFLGWDMMKFEEAVAGFDDFSYISPKDALFYGASDPHATFMLKQVMYPLIFKECPFIVKLDTRVTMALLRGQKEDHIVDETVLDEVDDALQDEIPGLRNEIWNIANYEFDINSTAQAADVLEHMGLDTGVYNKNGRMSTKADYLEKLDHPIAKKIVRYRKMVKWKSSFIDPLRKAARKGQPIRFKYYTYGAPTGRFSAGKDKKNPYFAPLNIQAILKPTFVEKYAHFTGDINKGILGWVFNDEESDRKCEVPDLKTNIRHAFKAPEGWWYVRIDYAGQELRIPANLSGEPTWIRAFNNGEDIHGTVCKEVFGKVNKDLRKETKTINFGIIYGSTAYAFAKKHNKTQEEADKFYLDYKTRHRHLFAWIKRVQNKAQRVGMAHTPFGRPRRLYHYFISPSWRIRAFAKRSAVNTIVQGGAADIFRIAFVNFYKKYFREFYEWIRFQIAVHDEIDFVMKKDKFGSEIEGILSLLRLTRSDWPVAMEVGLEVGTSWGDLVEFVKEDDIWVPKAIK